MEKLYIVHSDFDENNVYAEFNTEEEAIAYAKDHLEDGAYVIAVDVEIEDGEVTYEGDSECIWSYADEDALEEEVEPEFPEAPEDTEPVEEDLSCFVEELNDADEDEVECGWCHDMWPKSDCRKEHDLGFLCPQCQAEIKSRGEELIFIESNNLEEFYDGEGEVDPESSVEEPDNAVVKCEVAPEIAHSEDEKPLDCEMDKKPLDKPLTEETDGLKTYEIGTDDNEFIGTVEAHNEDEAYEKACEKWPEYIVQGHYLDKVYMMVWGEADSDDLAEATHAQYAKPEGDRVAAYNNALKYAKTANEPFIYGYTNHTGKFFALDQPVKQSKEAEFRGKYKNCSVVYVAYPDKSFVEAVENPFSVDWE